MDDLFTTADTQTCLSVMPDTEVKRIICTLSKYGIETFIKYANYFHKEQKRSFKNDPFWSASFYYNEETDGMYRPDREWKDSPMQSG